MDVTVAVLRAQGADFSVEPAVLDEPRHGEVLVELAGTGVCHTDLLPRQGVFFPVPGPMVLGHEGAGTVVAVGPGVRSVAVGDEVILSYASCGLCTPCLVGRPNHCDEFLLRNISGGRSDGTPTLRLPDGEPLFANFLGQSSFATHALAGERNVVKVADRDIPLEHLGPLGCGLMTGAGAVFNTLNPAAGQPIVIQGCGTVGLAAVMAAAASGCAPVVATDLHDHRLKLALEVGATHAVNPQTEGPVGEYVRSLVGRPPDAVIDTTGVAARDAVDAVGAGGTAILLAAMADITLNGAELVFGKTVKGVALGDAIPQVLIPRLLHLHGQGRFPFDKLIQEYPLEAINDAVADSENGSTVKPVLVPSR